MEGEIEFRKSKVQKMVAGNVDDRHMCNRNRLHREYGEVLVSMSSDEAEMIDQGIFYVVKGQILVPITISPEQYRKIGMGIKGEQLRKKQMLHKNFYAHQDQDRPACNLGS